MLVVGDIHFKAKHDLESQEFIQNLLKIVSKKLPEIVVLLGDILHTHNRVDVLAHNYAEELIEKLRKVAKVYVIIGNHDVINSSQFLTKNHIFGPFKKWKNVTIVDEPTAIIYNDKTFFFVPYVPEGRFVEALNTYKGDCVWEFADCIFAHQEFREFKGGDAWDPDYPIVISGHIHESSVVGENIYYPGSSTQQSHKDSQRSVWYIDWNCEEKEESNFMDNRVTVIDVDSRKRVLLKYDTCDENLSSEAVKELLHKYKSCRLKMCIAGTVSEIHNFKQTKSYVLLEEAKIIIDYDVRSAELDHNSIEPQKSSVDNSVPFTEDNFDEDINFKTIFQLLVKEKGGTVEGTYTSLFGDLLPLTVPRKSRMLCSNCNLEILECIC